MQKCPVSEQKVGSEASLVPCIRIAQLLTGWILQLQPSCCQKDLPCRILPAPYMLGLLWKQHVMNEVDWCAAAESPRAADKQLRSV